MLATSLIRRLWRWWQQVRQTPAEDAMFVAQLRAQEQAALASAEHARRRAHRAEQDLHRIRTWVDGDVWPETKGDDHAPTR